MRIENIISTLNKELISAFALLDRTFDEDEEFLKFNSDGRCAGKIMELVTASNHHLLQQIKSVTEQVLRERKDIDQTNEALEQYQLILPETGNPNLLLSLHLAGQEYIDATVKETFYPLRSILRFQLSECLDQLDLLKDGEGIHCKNTFISNEASFDAYQCFYLLANHCRRHVEVIEKLLREYEDTMEMR